jgi:hypothetical protein
MSSGLAHDGVVQEVLPSITRSRSADRSWHCVGYSSLCRENADESIAQQIEHHRRLGVPFEWKLYLHDEPADLGKRLQSHGFQIGPREAFLVYDLKNHAEWVDHAEVTRVVRIERHEQISDLRRVAESVFRKDQEATAAELSEALQTSSTQARGYIAYDRGEPVSVGRLYTHPQSWFAGLYGGGTLASHRGRGFYRAVVAARARDAIACAARYLQVDALPTSRPILERLGFQWITDTWPCEWKP